MNDMRFAKSARRSVLAAYSAIVLAAGLGSVAVAANSKDGRADVPVTAEFEKISYRATDVVAALHKDPGLNNPILAGFYPDPSIVRVGEDYYLVNSTFAYYPGLPIFHTKDLVHWEQVGNAIDRPSQLDFSGLGTSRGVYAPDITFKDGTYYLLNTCVDCKGNYLITAKDPKGPWSDPFWLAAIDGIDPSMFHDDDGKSYILNNGLPEEAPLYQGHRAIWMQQYDLQSKALVGPRKVVIDGGVDISKKPVWIEGPHLFKKDGTYYLIAAEGGTGPDHSEVVFRSQNVFGPYVPYENNPILTQRDLPADRAHPVSSSGHAEIFQTQKGQWWAVFLATRPYTNDLYNTGRETFIAPVAWKDGWPVIIDHGTSVPYQVALPDVAARTNPAGQRTSSVRQGYGHGTARLEWLSIRNPKADMLTVHDDQHIGLAALDEPIGDKTSHPSFIGLRQTSAQVKFATTVRFDPPSEGARAGVLAMQNDDAFAFCGVAKLDGKIKIILARRAGPTDPRDGVVLAAQELSREKHGPVNVTISINDAQLGCSYQAGGKADQSLIENADATFLSTQKAGGFVGTLIGPYAYAPKAP